MKKEELKKMAATYNGNGEFVGYYLSEEKLDQIAQECDCADDDGNYITAKLENLFGIQINFVDNTNANFGECEIIF